MALTKFPNDVSLRINYIFFLISKMNNKIKAAEQLEICEKLSEKNLEEEFIIFKSSTYSICIYLKSKS